MYDRRPPASDQVPTPPPPPSGNAQAAREANNGAKSLRLAVVREAVRMTERLGGNLSPASTETYVKQFTEQLLSFVVTGYWPDGTRPLFPRVNREDNDR